MLKIFAISGSRRGVDEICALLGCYAAHVRSLFFTDFSKKDIGTVFKGQGIDNWPEMSANNYEHTQRDKAEQRRSCLILFLLEVNETLFPVYKIQPSYPFLISNFRCVPNVVCFLLGNSPASEFYMPTFVFMVPCIVTLY